tara:strand:+ start:18 stop:482 length:465 start_codon:yes stop_codon:yes gene_type:complete
MTALVGRHICRIDKKGRVSVPKSFREVFTTKISEDLYVYPSFKYSALEACGEDFISKVVSSLNTLDMFSDDQDDIASTILENSVKLKYDSDGRVIIPKPLLKHAKIETRAVFVGRGITFQIWEPSAYEINNAATFERARAKGLTFQLQGSREEK